MSVVFSFSLFQKVLADKGRIFAEATAEVLRTVDGGAFKDALKSAVDVALSVEPNKALDSVDAVLETADAKSLQVSDHLWEEFTLQLSGTLHQFDGPNDYIWLLKSFIERW